MKQRLTEQDIKELRYQCRPGLVFPIMIIIIVPIFVLMILNGFDINYSKTDIGILILIIVSFSILIGHLITRKYLSDIRNGIKEFEIKKIKRKESKLDYEAGSGTLYIGQDMKGFDSYSLIIDNYRYHVDKELFEDCKDGDEVIFFFGPLSRFRLSIELRKNTRL